MNVPHFDVRSISGLRRHNVHRMTPQKSTVDEIRQRFDGQVERFSNLETGQQATMDSPLALELIARSAASVTPAATSLLDIGCGAGNYSLKVLQYLPSISPTLVDLSQPMLDRARDRVSATGVAVTTIQSDIRNLPLEKNTFDIMLAASVLHHLRDDSEWRAVFAKLFNALRPGGALWIFDLIEHSDPAVHRMMWERYGEYLTGLKGPEHRENVFAYVEKEDTPRPLMQQIDWLREAGFARIEILHKNGPFAAFGAIKRSWDLSDPN
jgi:tRNA (cmo5U34)-methyltransferase